jgi:dinuclear metal center YbgI/SA1388 family protein
MQTQILIQQLTDFLEDIAPLNLQEHYDNAGLITGRHDQSIKGILCSLDTTEEIIQEAIDLGCNVIVAHHPIIFKGLKKINGYHYVDKTIVKAIKNDIAIYAIHTNLDNVLISGVNTHIAQLLGLDHIQPLISKTEIINKQGQLLPVGTGIVGNFRIPMSHEQFLSFVKHTMKTSIIRYTDIKKQQIERVAVCGGSGASFLLDAKKQNADAYISSDFKYHEFFDGEGDLMITDIGHYESEQYTIDLLFNLITNKFSNFAVRKTSINTNPIKYYN